MALDTRFLFDALSPLANLPIADIYGQYSAVIDFFLYLIIFLGVARWTFEDRFKGVGGRAIIIGIGTSLALSLALAESWLGFSLRSLGLIAGLILVSLVGFLLFSLVHRAGAGLLTSVLLSAVVTYAGIGALAPVLLVWVNDNIPLIPTAIALALLFLIGKACIRIFHHAKKPVSDAFDSSLGREENEALDKERETLAPVAQTLYRERLDLAEEGKELKALYRDLGRNPSDPQHMLRVQTALRRARDRDQILRQRLDYVRLLNRKLSAFDLGLFHRLETSYKSLPPAQQVRFRKDIERERLKVIREGDVESLGRDAASLLTRLEAVLHAIEQEMPRGNPETLRPWVLKALRIDKNLDRTLAKLQVVEQQLFNLIPSRTKQTR